MKNVLPCVLSCGLVAAALSPAQESTPSPFAGIQPAMEEMQRGTWSADKAKLVVETLVKGGHLAAASWWVRLADDALAAKKLPPASQAQLAALRRSCESEGATADDRKLFLKAVRHLESLGTSKNFDEAKKLLPTVKTLGALAPDAAAQKALEAVEKKIAGGNNDPSNLPRQQKQWADMQDAVGALVKARIDRLVLEYDAAGCRPGRIALRTAIKNAHAILGADKSRALLVGLGKSARRIEPARTLSLLVRPAGEMRAMLDGEEIGAFRAEPLEIKVLEGDLIQFKVPEYGAPDEKKRTFHVALTSAQLDGKHLGYKHWHLSKSDDPATLEPELKSTGLIRLAGADPKLKGFRNAKELTVNGAFVAALDDRPVALPLREEHIDYEKDLTDRKLPMTWVGSASETCVLVLKIPEPGP
jgi:hypothetical protein